MAEICRILLVTLLLYVYWLLSDTRGEPNTVAMDSQTGDADETLTTTRKPKPTRKPPTQKTTTKKRGKPTTTTVAPIGPKKPENTAGEKMILELLTTLFEDNCEAAQALNVTPREMKPSKDYTAGQLYTINYISDYLSSDCKIQTDVPDVKQDKGFSNGDMLIMKLTSAYFASQCKVAKQVVENEASDDSILYAKYTDGEKEILKTLKSRYLDYCKHEPISEGGGGKSAEGGKTKESDPNDDAGRPLQSVVLELFLLIFGMCLTRIEL